MVRPVTSLTGFSYKMPLFFNPFFLSRSKAPQIHRVVAGPPSQSDTQMKVASPQGIGFLSHLLHITSFLHTCVFNCDTIVSPILTYFVSSGNYNIIIYYISFYIKCQQIASIKSLNIRFEVAIAVSGIAILKPVFKFFYKQVLSSFYASKLFLFF